MAFGFGSGRRVWPRLQSFGVERILVSLGKFTTREYIIFREISPDVWQQGAHMFRAQMQLLFNDMKYFCRHLRFHYLSEKSVNVTLIEIIHANMYFDSRIGLGFRRNVGLIYL